MHIELYIRLDRSSNYKGDRGGTVAGNGTL